MYQFLESRATTWFSSFRFCALTHFRRIWRSWNSPSCAFKIFAVLRGDACTHTCTPMYTASTNIRHNAASHSTYKLGIVIRRAVVMLWYRARRITPRTVHSYGITPSLSEKRRPVIHDAPLSSSSSSSCRERRRDLVFPCGRETRGTSARASATSPIFIEKKFETAKRLPGARSPDGFLPCTVTT